jgi:tetratricopeptide (TPR) repeat protein
MRVLALLILWCAPILAESPALDNRIARPSTDGRIAAYEKLAASGDVHEQNLLAGAYIQKMRETTDFGYIDRAARIVNHVLSIEPDNYESLRLRSEIGLERHQFAEVASFSRQMTRIAPDDAWNWGTLGDALMELGQYDGAADAYQKMVSLRPNQSSYNRASYYLWVMGDAEGAIAIMQRAIASGSSAPENTAWCQVDLGNLYFKTGRLAEAEESYRSALRTFDGYYPAYAGLGRVQAAQGKFAEAIASLKRAQSAVPMPEYAAALADLYAHRQEWRLSGNSTDRCHRQMACANNERPPQPALFCNKAELGPRAELAQAEPRSATMFTPTMPAGRSTGTANSRKPPSLPARHCDWARPSRPSPTTPG